MIFASSSNPPFNSNLPIDYFNRDLPNRGNTYVTFVVNIFDEMFRMAWELIIAIDEPNQSMSINQKVHNYM